MSRFLIVFSFLSLILCSFGCRICSTPYDCTISAYIDRHDDYRGSYPLYRGGSIFSGWCGYSDGEYVDYYSNAGNYGVTTPITLVGHTSSNGTGTFVSPPPQDTGRLGTGLDSIGIPNTFPGDRTIPTVEALINQQRGTMQSPLPMPITPPGMQRTAPRFEDMPTDVIPFSPSDAVPNNTTPSSIVPGDEVIIPPSTFPSMMETDPPITLEELRRLDPTIQDVQIISIEDASPLK